MASMKKQYLWEWTVKIYKASQFILYVLCARALYLPFLKLLANPISNYFFRLMKKYRQHLTFLLQAI